MRHQKRDDENVDRVDAFAFDFSKTNAKTFVCAHRLTRRDQILKAKNENEERENVSHDRETDRKIAIASVSMNACISIEFFRRFVRQSI